MAVFDNIEEELESMTSDELCAYAAYTFEDMTDNAEVLNPKKAPEVLVEEIMTLFELVV
jgi:hypothetical protein